MHDIEKRYNFCEVPLGPETFCCTLKKCKNCLEGATSLFSIANLTCVLCVDCRQVSSNDYSSLDSLTKSIVKEKQPFVRLEMSKEDLLEMFKVLLAIIFIY